MKREFVVERQGKSFILYAGLLSLAHEKGLKSIETTLVQIPSEANNRVAICSALVILEVDGVERSFTGIGDAAPNNVAPAMQNALIRLAETRAKARALRDAVNVGVAAFEELGEESEETGAPERGYPARTQTRRSTRPATPTLRPAMTAELVRDAGDDSPILNTQVAAITTLCQQRGVAVPDMSGWTRGQGAQELRRLQSRVAA